MNTTIEKMKVFVPESIEVIEKAIDDIETCLVEAPIDFLGTGSNWKVADREEREWRKKWKDALVGLKNSIKTMPPINEQRTICSTLNK